MTRLRATIALVATALVLVTGCDFRATGSVSCSTGSDGVTRCTGSGQGAPSTAVPTTTQAPAPTTTRVPAPAPTTTRAPVPAPTTTRVPQPTQAPAPSDSAAARFAWGTPLPASDEFNYSGAPDPRKWGVYGLGGSVGGAGSNCWEGHSGNGRRCAVRNIVGDGFLRQTGLANGDSAGIASKLDQRFGRWEVRARMSAVAGARGGPYHPVLITWNDTFPYPKGAEYDFLETNIGDKQATAFLHYPNHQPKRQETASKSVDLTQWHNYGFQWTASGLVGYLDGVEWFRFAGNGIQNAPGPMHLTIQLDNFYGAGGMQAATFDVDYARVYRV